MLRITKKIFNNIPKSERGFSLVEMIVYLSIMTIIALVIVQSVTIVIKSNKESFNNNLIENTAVSILERVKRETRRAKTIDSEESSLANGIVQLNIVTNEQSTSSIKVALQGDGSVFLHEDNIFIGPLTVSGAEVTQLSFKQIITEKSEALKIVMTIKSGDKTETFYSTQILRGSY